jgi:hypothetical protein
MALWAAAHRPARPVQPTYIGLAVLAALLVFVLIKAYGVWQEIHDVEVPDSPQDLLASFEQAHAAGELDEAELERVRARLRRSATFEGPASAAPAADSSRAPGPPGTPVDRPGEPSSAEDSAPRET